jgi:predicted dienelactone hydrolase
MTSSFDNRIDGLRPDARPLARGLHSVGVRTTQVVDAARLHLDGGHADRALTVELWYPTAATGAGGRYDAILRDGVQRIVLHGSALRDAPAMAGDWPLVILSHGYPGNRHLMAHLGEALASHGYRVASIDHPGSTYDDKQAFAQTLWHRPLDQQAVARALGGDHVIIGYSMGGYGALISAGAGISAAALEQVSAEEAKVYARHRDVQADPALKGIVPIGPWGRQKGIWDAQGLGAVRVPMLVMAGDRDEISGYAGGMRLIFEEVGGPHWLLTYHHAGHNAAAPMPAPREAWVPSPHLEFVPFEHYADPVWDTLRMNNIAAHVAAGFLAWVLKGEGAGPEAAGIAGVTLEVRG